MSSDIAYGVALLMFVSAVVAWVYWPDSKPTTTTTTAEPGLVLQVPPLTPLPRDSGPKNNQRPRTLGSTRAIPTKRGVPLVRRKARNRVPVKTRRAPKRKATRRPARQAPARPAQPGQNPPPPAPQPSRPPVCVTAPAPVTVTTPAAGVNTC